MDKRTSMGVIGNLNAYTQFQTANAIPDAAKNPGGLGAIGAGIAMGAGMAGAVQQGMTGNESVTPPGPPPLPQGTKWFAALNGQQAGPFTTEALKDKVTAGSLTRETMVWKQGLPQWTTAGSIAELAQLFADLPPALP